MHQGMTAVLATGQTLSRSLSLVLLAEAAAYIGQVEEGLRLLTDALAAFEVSSRGDMLTEAYRLQGELMLYKASQNRPAPKPASSGPWLWPDASKPNPRVATV